MQNQRVEIHRALSSVSTVLAGLLADDGWQRRPYSTPELAVFTRPIGDVGVVSVVEVRPRKAFPSGPTRWPVRVGVRFGCGYEPATALMPLLTLSPRGILLEDRPIAGAPAPLVMMGLPGAARSVARELAGLVAGHSSAAGHAITTIHALDEALIARAGSTPDDRAVERRLLLLASSGRLDQARELLDQHLATVPARPSGRPFRPRKEGTEDAHAPFRRFARQLDRWLAAGGPPIPAVENTLALMPPRSVRPPWPRRARRREIDHASKAARRAVMEAARGRSRAEIADLLSAALEAEGLEARQLAFNVDTVEEHLRPLGRARSSLSTIWLVATALGTLTRLLRKGIAVDPDWLQPPERAGWTVGINEGGRRWSLVELDPAAQPFLAKVAAEGSNRIGSLVIVDGWLTEAAADDPGEGGLVVNLGGRAVGTLSTAASAELAPDVAAARTLFDELVRIRLNLLRPDKAGSALLEMRLPDRPAEGFPSTPRQGLR